MYEALTRFAIAGTDGRSRLAGKQLSNYMAVGSNIGL